MRQNRTILAAVLCLLSSVLCRSEAQIPRSHRADMIHSTVATWHAFDYDAANTRYRNLGRSQGGSTLYLNEPVSTAARPRRITGNGFVFLPGVAGNDVSTPDSAALSIAGDLEIHARLSVPDWTPGSQFVIVGKSGAADTISYNFRLNTDGTLSLVVTADGSTAITFTSSASVPGVDYAPLWVRVTFDADNGAAGSTAEFSTGTNGASWSPLGSAQTSATGGITLYDGATAVRLGSRYGSTEAMMLGDLYAVRIYSGIGGTLVGNFDASLSAQTGYTDTATSPTCAWTINRTSTGLRTVLVTTAAAARWLPDGVNDQLSCGDSDLLDFGDGVPFTVFALTRAHGTPDTEIALSKRIPGAAGYVVSYNNSRATVINIGDGTDSASVTAADPGDHTLGLMAGVIDATNATAYTNAAAGTPASRATVNSMANATDLYAFSSPDSLYWSKQEQVAIGVARRALTTAEQKRLVWELQSYGPRFFLN